MYLDSCPPAVSGQGGHNQCFFVACRLYNGWALNEHQTLYWLSQYNSKCQPPWSERELHHKVQQAMKVSHSEARGHMLGDSRGYKPNDLRDKVAMPKPNKAPVVIDAVGAMTKYLDGFSCTEAELSEASPVVLEDWTDDGWVMLDNLFQPDELVNYVIEFELYEKKKGDKQTKANPMGKGITAKVADLVKEWKRIGTPFSDAGGWFRINPVNGKGINDQHVTAFRYALVEFDAVPLELQISFLARVPLPIAAILTSGGKSVHAWIRVDADDHKDYEATVERMRNVLTPFGVDRTNKILRGSRGWWA